MYVPAGRFGTAICPVPFVISRSMFWLFMLTVSVPSIDIVAVIIAFSPYMMSSPDIVMTTSDFSTLTVTTVEFKA